MSVFTNIAKIKRRNIYTTYLFACYWDRDYVCINMSKRLSIQDNRSGNSGCRKLTKNDDVSINKINMKTVNDLEEEDKRELKTESSVKYLHTPTQSLSDRKEYRVIHLDNGLTALLISDKPTITLETNEESSEGERSESEDDVESSEEEASSDSEDEVTHDSSDEASDKMQHKSSKQDEKLAAVALCIGVGSFSDPWEIPGMAHFLEHMVFMGSEKFPKENDFDAFIKKRGGSDNASTDGECTTFYFESQEKHLAEAMDKFSQFFIAPLMKREAMTREREAIESEFQMSLPSHYSRKQQLLTSLAHEGHPATKFMWGNLITLQDNVSDDELYSSVHKFRKKHYSAHRMTLAIQARLPLSTLESWVRNCFSAIPNNCIAPDDFKQFVGVSFDTAAFRRLYRIHPVKDICQVELTWALPPLLHKYRSKPDHYLESVLGYEGKGSLLAYLRKKVWALDIFTGSDGSGVENNSMYLLFNITLVLTEMGYKNLSKVLDAVFGYIKLLQRVGPCERIFKELQTIEDASFRFTEEVSAADYVEVMAENMQFYPPQDYITGPRLYYEYDPELIRKCLDALTPESVNIIVCSKNSDVEYNLVEPWFNTKYTVSDIPIEWLAAWKSQEPDQYFTLPESNIYLTTDFTLKSPPEPVPAYPVKIRDDDLIEVWYRPDNKFKLPIAYIYFYFISPLSVKSPLNAAMLELLVVILNQHLVEDVYQSVVAQLSSSLYASDKGMILKVDGYNQKLHLLLETIIKHMSSFEVSLNEELFEAMKDEQSKHYYNCFLKPHKLVRDLRFTMVLEVYWSAVDKHAANSQITIEMIKIFAKEFFEHLYIQCLVQGNFSKEETLNVCSSVIEHLKCEPLIPSARPQLRVSQVPLGKQCIRVKSFSTQDANSMVINYYQSGPANIRTSCIGELIMLLMEEPVFDMLRTKEQLGYDVSGMLRDTFGILGFSITVNCQANKHSTEHVDERIEAFLISFTKKLKKMSEKEFEEFRQTAIKLKKCTDLYLKEEVSRNWDEITNTDYVFDRLEKEVECLEMLKSLEIRKWLDNHIECGSKSNFRKLSLQVVGHMDESKKECKCPSSQERVRRHSKGRLSTLQVNRNNSGPLPVAHDANFKYSLQIQSDLNSEYLITNIDEYKKNLFIYPANQILP